MNAQPAMKIEPQSSVSAPHGEEREKSHRSMLSAVAHDLKTPLASIIGSLEVYNMMHHKLPAEKQLELVRVALQEAHRLDNFMTNILDMAKLENDALKPKMEIADVSGILHNAVARMDNNLRGGSISVTDTNDIKLMTDAALLSRALFLIIDNAIKYSGTPPIINMDYVIEGNSAVIRVRDNGQGIPAEKAETIFNKYIRLERPDQKPVSGLGLGLPIARKLIDLLNGKITASTHEEGGAVISIFLPV